MGVNVDNEAMSMSVVSSGCDSLMQLNCSSPAVVALNNPEVITLVDTNLGLFNEMYTINNALIRSDFVYTVSSTCINLISYLTMLVLVYMFVIFYFYTNNKLNTSESCADNDYLSLWSLTESEKELGSADDLVLLIIIVTYIFG